MNQPKKIMVVEDDPDLLEMLVALLESEGYTAVGAKTGTEAFRMIDSDLPDLILLDIMLPDISGIEVSKRIVDGNGNARRPVFFLSGKTDLSTRLRCFINGGRRFIPKPFELDSLLESISSEFAAAS